MNTSLIKKTGAIALAMVFFLFFAPFTAGALIPIEVAKLVAPDGAAGDYFGYSVAVDGDTAVIGAYGVDYNGFNSGAAYVFIRSGSNWVLEAKLAASDRSAGDFFGYSVALDGDTAVIGAFNDDDNGPNSGSAYVFIRSGSTWVQQAKLTASDGAEYDSFGISVAVYGDTAVIGADYDDDKGQDSGSAYVFIRSGSTWVQQAKLTVPDGTYSDSFGYSVAVDGDTAAVIGVRYDDDMGDNSGSAYVFILTAPDSDGDGVPDDQDNYPDIPNPDQTDPGSGTPGGGCDVNIDAAAVAGAIELKCEESVGILTQANPPGVKGMIGKLTGNGSVAAKVANAVYDYADCTIDANAYIEKLNAALNQLDAYDSQLEVKIDSGKIKGNDASLVKGFSDDASLLEAYSDNMRITINNLIGDAMP